ncbi:hypothetical protein MNB_SM-4-1756 [hydrothermal vent metagenome]|uniref:Uncharacterized protein n=1 Tax=hydrothermal vent metagenome TaxID=652676 RepID=A0A1W1C5Y5_9ZZZZ
MSILFFALAGLYIAFMVFVMKQTIKRVKKYKIVIVPSVFIVLLLIPTWDYILGKQVFDEYCKNEAGLHIYEDIEKVDSIYVEGMPPYFFLDYKYEFVEGKEKDKYYKYYFNDDTSPYCIKRKNKWQKNGKCIVKIEINEPVSIYKINSTHIVEPVTKIVKVYERKSPVLYEMQTNRKMAEIFDYYWYQGWFSEISGFFRSVSCKDTMDDYDKLISKTTMINSDIYMPTAKSFENRTIRIKDKK